MDGYDYTYAHTLTCESELTDYQLKFIIYYGSGTSSGNEFYTDGYCMSDFSDIRFSIDRSTALPFWIESYTNGESAIIWVRVPTISTSQTMYIHYGNGYATYDSNGDDTFQFFDDFNGSSVDTEKWTTVNSNGSISVSDSYLRMNIAASSNGRAYGAIGAADISTHISGVKMRMDSADGTTCEARFGVKANANSAGVGIILKYTSDGIVAAIPYDYDSATYGTNLATGLSNGTFYHFEIRHESGILYYRMGTSGPWSSWSVDSSGSYLQISNSASLNFAVTDFDLVYQRKYAAVEPIHGYWTEIVGDTITPSSRNFIIG